MSLKLRHKFSGLSLAGGPGPALPFVRATSATFRDYNNVLRTVDSGEPRYTGARRVTNMFWRSNVLNLWQAFSGSETANATTDPFGGNDAWEWRNSTDGGPAASFLRQNVTHAGGERLAQSYYVKAGSINWCYLQLVGTDDDGLAYFDLENGVVGSKTATIESGISANQPNGTPLPESWYRVWVNFSTTSDLTSDLRIGLAEGDNDNSIERDGTSYIYIYGAMLQDTAGEESASPSEYIDVPSTTPITQWFGTKKDGSAFDTPPLGLLLEEERTNIALQSGDLSTTWLALNAETLVTANAATAPNGNEVAFKLSDQNGGGSGSLGIYQNVTITSATDHVFSCWFQADGLDWVALSHFNFDNSGFSYFDLTNGVVGTRDANHSDSGIEDWGGGLYRCWIVMQSTTDLAGSFAMYVSEADLDNGVPYDGTSSIFAWGADIQEGGIPSSHIETTTIAVTRDVDDAEHSDMSWYNSNGGVLYIKYQIPHVDTTGTGEQFPVTLQTDTNNYINIYKSGTPNSFLFVRSGGANQAIVGGSTSWTDGDTQQQVGKFLQNDFNFWVDGVQTGTPDTAGTIPAVASMIVGNNFAGTKALMGHVDEIRYYDDDDLTDDELLNMSNGAFPVSGRPGIGLSFGKMGA